MHKNAQKCTKMQKCKCIFAFSDNLSAENSGIEKSIGFGFEKKIAIEKYLKKILVSKSIGIQKVWIVENVQISKVSRLLKTYSGENSNKRNECDYASSRADHLRTHLKRHSGRIQTNVTNVTLPHSM